MVGIIIYLRSERATASLTGGYLYKIATLERKDKRHPGQNVKAKRRNLALQKYGRCSCELR